MNEPRDLCGDEPPAPERGALDRAHNNKSQAAKLLGLSRGELYSLLRRHGLTEARR